MNDILWWAGAIVMIASVFVPDARQLWTVTLDWWVYLFGAALLIAAIWTSPVSVASSVEGTVIFGAVLVAAWTAHIWRNRREKDHASEEVQPGQGDGQLPEEAGGDA